MKRSVVCAAVFCMLTVGAQADTGSEPRPHLFVMGTLTNVDSARNIEDDGNGWQIGLGYPLTDHLYIEGIYFDNTLETGDGQGSDFYQRGGGVDLQYSFGDRERFTPYVLAGIGGVDNDVVPDSLDEDAFYANVGVGFVGRLFNLQWLRYRAEARYVHDDYLDGMDDLRVGLGLEVALGAKERVREVTVERVVYKEAAPREVDSDGDGVLDSHDDCPETYAGAKVDGRGCVVERQTLNIENIGFDYDSAELGLNAENILRNAVSFLKSQPNLHAEIAGHTDNTGAADYNQALSQRRAVSVEAYLVRSGIAAQRLSSRGYGESNPVASNATAEGREANRRVELRLIPR